MKLMDLSHKRMLEFLQRFHFVVPLALAEQGG
jgi:hypothetical protein